MAVLKQMLTDDITRYWSIRRVMAAITFVNVLGYIWYALISDKEISDALVIELLGFIGILLGLVAYTNIKKDVSIQQDKPTEARDVPPGYPDSPEKSHYGYGD